jgi:hypothetical protein
MRRCLSLALLGTTMFIAGDEVYARGRLFRRQRVAAPHCSACTPDVAVDAGAPLTPVPSTAAAPAANGQDYRSYSYEPAAGQPESTAVAPAGRTNSNRPNLFRADRKVRGR